MQIFANSKKIYEKIHFHDGNRQRVDVNEWQTYNLMI